MRFLERTVETIELRETRLISSLSYFGNKKVSEVTVSDAKELRNALYFLPANYKKIHSLSEMKIKDVCRYNRSLGERGYRTITKLTVEGYISALRSFFEFLVDEGLIEKNPFSKIKMKRADLVRPDMKNHTLSEDELSKIFNYIESKYNSCNGFKYWVLYLLRFTGARVKEIIQLSSNDLIFKDGIYCLYIYPDEYKTKCSGRVIPLHPKLIEMGFLDFVMSKDGALFNDAIHEGKAISYKTSKWSAHWRSKLGLKKGKNLISFRHTMIDQLKKNGVNIEMRAQIGGHSINNTTADVYSKDYSISEVYKVISGIKA